MTNKERRERDKVTECASIVTRELPHSHRSTHTETLTPSTIASASDFRIIVTRELPHSHRKKGEWLCELLRDESEIEGA